MRALCFSVGAQGFSPGPFRTCCRIDFFRSLFSAEGMLADLQTLLNACRSMHSEGPPHFARSHATTSFPETNTQAGNPAC